MPRITKDIAEAAARLRGGGVVAIPTETVYGLAGLAQNDAAVKKVFALKKRPADHPLILHTDDFGRFTNYAEKIPETAHKLAAAYLPGPLTMLLPRRAGVAELAAASSQLVALRVPAHPVAQRLLDMIPGTLAAPSANCYGRISPTCAEHVADDHQDIADLLILDGGPCQIGLESTVAEVGDHNVMLTRPGSITAEMIQQASGVPCLPQQDRDIGSPGSRERHYAPRTPLTVVHGEEFARLEDNGAALLGFKCPASCRTANWTKMPADPENAARDLYNLIRQLDKLACARIIAEQPPSNGSWTAVRDRLGRASALVNPAVFSSRSGIAGAR